MKRIISLGVAAALAATGAVGAITAQGQSSSLPTINVALTKTSIAVSGALQSGGVNIRSTTSGEPDGTLLLLRLNPGVTADQALAFMRTKAGRDDNNISRVGTVVVTADAPKGTSDVQTTLQPGDYLAVAIGHGDKPPPGGFPHTSFTIAPAAQPAVLPTPKATVKAIDFGYRGAKTLHVGDLDRFVNNGHVQHMIIGVRVDNVAAARKLERYVAAGNDKKIQPLVRGFVGFQGPVSPGQSQQLVIKAKPGVYVLACFEDTQDHREHTKIGMLRIIRIKQ